MKSDWVLGAGGGGKVKVLGQDNNLCRRRTLKDSLTTSWKAAEDGVMSSSGEHKSVIKQDE